MNSYKFSMENILKWREDIERNNMEDLASIQNQLRSQKARKTDLLREKEDIKSSKLRYRDISQLKYENLYMEKIEEKIKSQDKLIRDTKNKLEDVRQDFIEAQKDRKIMDKLKERDMEAYRQEVNKKEQKELDELTILKYKNQNVL